MNEEFEACGSFVRTKCLSDGSGGLLVAECAYNNGFGELTAKLFASAPELLFALHGLCAYADLKGDLFAMPLVTDAKAAIAKAGGRNA